jgi:hypothetical protein
VTKCKGICSAVGLGAVLLLGLLTILHPQRTGYAAGYVYCVVPPGESTGPFAACDQVFTSVQEAVDTAVPDSEIWVATGVYTDVHEYNGRYQVVYIDKSITIEGGYTIPFSDPPDPTLHMTTLDARDSGRVLFVTGDISVTITGLHLTGGWSRMGGFAKEEFGGGVYVEDATILLQNNVIAGNLNSPVDASYGGGIYLTAVHATLRGNHIHNNFGIGQSYGGGLAAHQSTLVLQNNRIMSNTAGVQIEGQAGGIRNAGGGGVYAFASQVLIEENEIGHNVALQTEDSTLQGGFGYGGGLLLVNSSGRVAANSFHHNLATATDLSTGFGGGIHMEGSGSLELSDNLIEGNVASQSWYGNGGGLVALAESADALSVVLHNNQIVNNMAVVSGTLGIGGGVAVFGRSESLSTTIALTHNLILSNTAVMTGNYGLGGGLLIAGSQLHMDQNRIAGNVAVFASSDNHGGGFYLAGNQTSVTRNVIGHNQTAAGGGLLLAGGVTAMENTAVIDNQGGGLHLMCNASLAAAHLTIARNTDSGIHLAHPLFCGSGNDPLPSTAVFTNTILAGHPVGAFVTAGSDLTLHGVLWHDTPSPFQAEPGAQITITHQHFGDPLFAPDGYHITAESAARFRGLPAGVMIDIDGQPRPAVNPALGADEYWLMALYMPLVLQHSP